MGHSLMISFPGVGAPPKLCPNFELDVKGGHASPVFDADLEDNGDGPCERMTDFEKCGGHISTCFSSGSSVTMGPKM
eukprot:4852693-Karenia_brevis.AAC.1